MARYDWQNVKTGEVVETNSPSDPPSKKGKWRRLYSFGLGKIEGGASPAWPIGRPNKGA